MSTLERSTAGGEGRGWCANTGRANAIMVAATAILSLFISTPGDFSDVLAHDCIAADSGSAGRVHGRRSPRAICYAKQAVRCRRDGRREQEGTRIMTSPIAAAVGCDLHPAVPHLTSLLPYLNAYWRDQVTTRGMTDLVSQSYPANSPISSRPDWRPAMGKPRASL